MPKGRGRGRGAGGIGNKGGKGAPQASRDTTALRVCKPSVTKLPPALQIQLHPEGVPQSLQSALTEFRNCQPFFSALERIAPELTTPATMNLCWAGLPGETFVDLERPDEDGFKGTLIDSTATYHPVFIKRIHIVDPLACIEGECIWPTEGALPAPAELWMNALDKLTDPMNEAYVDAVFALLAERLVTSGISPHWLRCYGTFAARVDRYSYNITEEYPSLRRKSFWNRHQALGLFALKKEIAKGDESRRRKEPLAVSFSEDQEMDVGDFETPPLPTDFIATSDTFDDSSLITNAAIDFTKSDSTYKYEIAEESSDIIEAEDVASVQLNTPLVRIRPLKSDDTSASLDSSSDSEDSEEDYMDYFAEFRDFPVQVTLLERAEGTLDELLDREEIPAEQKEAEWRSWIFQIIAALTCAQHWFGFVHNDLHTNNVMWTKTDREYLWYRIQKKGKGGAPTTTGYYRVPTHGYLMKIIDFGRASFHLPDPAGFFISDAFFPGNDACQQYNCDPFYDPRGGKKVEPNPSFDLSRLAVSLLEGLYPIRPANATPIQIMSREGPKTYAKTTSDLYNLMWEWLTDDQGKNILREPNGVERYPDFDLYSAIAADIHRAVPWQQIEKTVFADSYKVAEAPAGETVYDLWIH